MYRDQQPWPVRMELSSLRNRISDHNDNTNGELQWEKRATNCQQADAARLWSALGSGLIRFDGPAQEGIGNEQQQQAKVDAATEPMPSHNSWRQQIKKNQPIRGWPVIRSMPSVVQFHSSHTLPRTRLRGPHTRQGCYRSV